MLTFPATWTEDGHCACPKGSICSSPGKHPLTRNGVKDATDDATQIAAWREQWPRAHWAIATGAGSGVVVVDLDRKPGKDGVAELRKLAATHGAIPRTRTVRTGSGGLHLYFRHPGGHVPNTASKIAPGIDTRGDGGYVMAPGCGHVSGGRYEVIVDVLPADLPAWLLDLLSSPASSRPATPTGATTFFPATNAVLDRAREALAVHGPAVEGNGGDEHTFRAAAILTHDFALTFEEAWPLFVEWNATCSPPWSAEDLETKLRNGDKYGTRARGIARQPEALAMGRALINGFRGNDAGALLRLLEPVLAIASATDWPQIEREFKTASGYDLRKLGARPPVHFDAPPPDSVTVTTELAEVADLATAVIAPTTFTRNGVLCEVVRAERTFLSDLAAPRVVDLLSRGAKWVRHDTKGAITSTTPPDAIAQILCARRTHKGMRVIESVTTAPVFLADGSILQERGYNAQARVFLEPSVAVIVADDPTRDDARRAAASFWNLLSDFHFAEKADFSAWLAGLLSPLVKSAIGNAPVPLIAVSASSPGAGKTLLTTVAARIIMGTGAEVRPYNPRDPSEWGKRLTAFVRAAAPISVFDNVAGPFGDESLDRLLTSSSWADRVLGASDAPPIPVVTTWWATGNNIEPHGDTVRRVLPVRIVVDTERPQERSGFKIPNLEQHVTENRADYLAAALTILRAYHVAGRPTQALPSWGSFEAWSALVRNAIAWIGLPDPFLTQARATREWNEPDNDAHDFWIAVVGESDGSPASIVTTANQRDAQGVLGARQSITTHSLRGWIGRFIDRPRRGARIVRDAGRYAVSAIA